MEQSISIRLTLYSSKLHAQGIHDLVKLRITGRSAWQSFPVQYVEVFHRQ